MKGPPQAIKTVFPSVNIQTCIVHQIRNSLKYIASKDKKEFIRDLKCVYKAPTEEMTLAQLDKRICEEVRLSATMEIMEKWVQPIPNWGSTLAQLTIKFPDQLKEDLA